MSRSAFENIFFNGFDGHALLAQEFEGVGDFVLFAFKEDGHDADFFGDAGLADVEADVGEICSGAIRQMAGVSTMVALPKVSQTRVFGFWPWGASWLG